MNPSSFFNNFKRVYTAPSMNKGIITINKAPSSLSPSIIMGPTRRDSPGYNTARRDSPRYKTARRDSPGYINSPKSSPSSSSSSSSPMQRLTPPTLRILLDLDSRGSPGNNNHRARANSSEHDEILSLISYCSYNVYTFTDPSESPLQQNLKSEKLARLLSIVRSPPLKAQLMNDKLLSPLFSMISANLFRPLPPPPRTSATSSAAAVVSPDDEDLAPNPAPAWPHLQIVHDILLRLIASAEPKALRKHVDGPFILSLLALFGSEDPRERECVKNAYHKIYSRLHHSRSFMRKAMNGVFLDYIFEPAEFQRQCGIGDLLEIWGTIINGFSVPLKDEHKLFLARVLVPLHRPKGMQAYHKQLAYCVYQFVEKEPMLGVEVVRGILRHWPVTNCHKEVLLVGELEELVDSMGPEQYKILALPLCKRIAKCLNSWNSQVAERALYVWNNERFVKMASEAIEDVFPVLVEGMERNLRWHWSRSVRQLTQNVKEMLEEMEPTLYSTCLLRLRLDHGDDEREIRRKEMWERVEMAANANGVERSITSEDQSFLCEKEDIFVCMYKNFHPLF